MTILAVVTNTPPQLVTCHSCNNKFSERAQACPKVNTMKIKLSVPGRLLITIVLLTVIYPGHIFAVDLGPECEPSGLVAKGKEAWNPKEFWKTQIKEIEEYVEGQKTDFRLSMIERRRGKINQRLDDEEMKAMSIDNEQYSNPEADRFLAEADRELLQIERGILNEAIEWGRKCTAYAKRKLSQLE